MGAREVLRATSDATLRSYERSFDALTLELDLWDETTALITAAGVTLLVDTGTWEADAVVRVPELDGDGRLGYGIIDTEGTVTLRFAARRIDL